MADEHHKAFMVPEEPSEMVRAFLKEHPDVKWEDSLRYVLDHYKQVEDGKVMYLVEGGAALKLLFPNRQEPGDLDIVTRSDQMQKDFSNSRSFDVKSLSLWYASRLHPHNPRAFDVDEGDFLMDMNQPVRFGDREVLILNPLALAVSKTLQYLSQESRQKDREDLTMLNQDPQQIQSIITRVQAITRKPLT